MADDEVIKQAIDEAVYKATRHIQTEVDQVIKNLNAAIYENYQSLEIRRLKEELMLRLKAEIINAKTNEELEAAVKQVPMDLYPNMRYDIEERTKQLNAKGRKGAEGNK